MHNDSFYLQIFIPLHSMAVKSEWSKTPVHVHLVPNGIGMDCPHVVQAAICILKQPHFQSRYHKVDDVDTTERRWGRVRRGGPVKSSTSLQRSLPSRLSSLFLEMESRRSVFAPSARAQILPLPTCAIRNGQKCGNLIRALRFWSNVERTPVVLVRSIEAHLKKNGE